MECKTAWYYFNVTAVTHQLFNDFEQKVAPLVLRDEDVGQLLVGAEAW